MLHLASQMEESRAGFGNKSSLDASGAKSIWTDDDPR
jgi:hypothetical protein